MHLLELTLLDMRAADKTPRLRGRSRRSTEGGEALAHLGDHRGVIDRAGGRHHHVGCAIIPLQIIAQASTVERAHRAWRAEDRASERLVGKSRDLQMLENEIV